MEILLLLLLLVSAGALYLPELLKERALDSPIDTISDFRRGMTALAISTHNMDPRDNRYYSTRAGETEPYVRRNSYPADYDYAPVRDSIPYPQNKAQAEMETRRNRIIAVLLFLTLATGIMVIVPSLRWAIPVHILLLVALTAYIGIAVLLPHRDSRR